MGFLLCLHKLQPDFTPPKVYNMHKLQDLLFSAAAWPHDDVPMLLTV